MFEPLDIVHPQVAGYLDRWAAEPDPVRSEMEAYAQENGFPIIGPLVGGLLAVLARGVGIKRVFELGSGYGYSALWFARATASDARIFCTELDAENIRLGRDWHRRAGVSEKVDWVCEDALAALDATADPLDLIFCDIAKIQYPEALKLAWPKLRPGGLMITDNVLWSGKVVAGQAPDPETAAIIEFTRDTCALPDGDSTIIPLRDGLMISRKHHG